MERAQGFAQQGGEQVYTAGIASVTLVQESYPFATITVFLSGTTVLAALYSDNQTMPTPLANPFTADENGYWYFYAANGRYDVMIDSPELETPWTIGDVLLNDPGGGGGGVGSQTPWLSNIDGGGFSLSNVDTINVTGGYLINGAPVGLWSQTGAGQIYYTAGNVGIANSDPQYPLDVIGSVNVTGQYLVNGVPISSGGQSQSPWLGPINGGGFSLSNVATINVTGGYYVNGQPLAAGYWIQAPGGGNNIYYPGMVGINQQAPAYALDVVGSVNVTDNYYVNGVAIGTGGGGPWNVLTGSRIYYNGSVGFNQTNPQYPIDVVGNINVTGSYMVNGVPIGTGGSGNFWQAGSAGVIYYNGGNVGVGISSPTSLFQVNGALSAITVAITASGLPANSTVLTVAGDITCTNSIECTGQVIGSAFGIPASGSPASGGGFVISSNGAFIGAGVDVLHNNGNPGWAGPFGIACADLTTTAVGCAGPISCIQTGTNESAFLAEGAVVSADATAATTGGSAVEGGYWVQPLGQSPILCITNTAQFYGSGGVNTTGNISTTGSVYIGGATPTITLSAAGSITAAGAITSNSVTAAELTAQSSVIAPTIDATSTVIVGGQTAINSSAQFVGSGGVYTTGNVTCDDMNSVSTYATQWIGAASGYQVGGTTVIDSSRNVYAATVNATGFTVTGGNPGASLVVSWYGASSSGGAANVEHQLVFEQGLCVSGY
jgi:hypothetical protein